MHNSIYSAGGVLAKCLSDGPDRGARTGLFHLVKRSVGELLVRASDPCLRKVRGHRDCLSSILYCFVLPKGKIYLGEMAA